MAYNNPMSIQDYIDRLRLLQGAGPESSIYPTLNPTQSSNLGLGGPTVENAPPEGFYPNYDSGFRMPLTHTPAASDVVQTDALQNTQGYYPYAGDVTPEQFTFQPQDFATGSALGGPEYAAAVADPTWAAGATPYTAEGLLASGGGSAAAEGAAEAGGSAWGGPATFAGNMALNMIPTKDKEKVDTPFGDEGSVSGIAKGMGKGALLGGTVTGGNPYAIAGGAVLGAIGGAGGYFDSTSPPQISISRIRQGRGMPTGGGLMYA